MKQLLSAAAIVIAVSLASSAQAVLLRWEFTSDESQINNPGFGDGSTDSPATGVGLLEYDTVTNMMHARVTWDNTIGDITKLHVHGLADENSSTPRHILEFLGPPTPELGVNYTGDPKNGVFEDTFEVTTLIQPGFDPIPPTQIIDELMTGQTYLNIHTDVFGAGEIRGNLGLAVPEPASALMLAGLAGTLLSRRRR